MDGFIIFGLGILTCVVIFCVVYCVITIKTLKDNSEEMVDDVEELKIRYNTLKKEFEDKIDTHSISIEEVDVKFDTIYKESAEVINERFEEIDVKVFQNESKISEIDTFMENSKKDDF